MMTGHTGTYCYMAPEVSIEALDADGMCVSCESLCTCWCICPPSGNAAVAVDTGLGHLASALAVPCVSVYGSTDPKRTGTHGLNQAHLQSDKDCAPCLKRSCSLKGPFEIDPPCFESVNPARVWAQLQKMLSTSDHRRLA